MSNIYRATSHKYNISQYHEDKSLLVGANCWAEDLVITEIPRNEWLLSQVPEEFRSVLSYYSWEHGHSAGEDEVNLILGNIINELKPAIDKFEARIKSERA